MSAPPSRPPFPPPPGGRGQRSPGAPARAAEALGPGAVGGDWLGGNRAGKEGTKAVGRGGGRGAAGGGRVSGEPAGVPRSGPDRRRIRDTGMGRQGGTDLPRLDPETTKLDL